MNISVIIPTLNEAAHLGRALASLRGQSVVEVIVVDGGSVDGTASLAHSMGAVVVRAARGRATQMNAGARRARGDVLLFLHADTQLPSGAVKLIERTLSRPGVIAGSFCLSFDHPHPILGFYAWLSRLNNRYCTFGDQGLFFRRPAFDALNGYREDPLMEDLEIQHRARPLGRFVKIPVPVRTSARRFREVGVVKQQLLNILLVTLYELGVSAQTLKRFYS